MKPLQNHTYLHLILLLNFLLGSTILLAQTSNIQKRNEPTKTISQNQVSMDRDTVSKNILIIKAEGSGGIDKTQIVFNPLASSGYDEDVDRIKIILANIKRPQIFTFADEYIISSNLLPDTTMLDMAIRVSSDGTYKISIERSLNFNFVVLEDLILHTKINLLNEDYSFEYFTSDGDYPFKLYFSDWALQEVEESDIDIYYYPESLVVRSRKQVNFAEITFFDLAGREAFQFYERDFFLIEKPIHLPTGHYIVQLRSNDLVINKKVLVRR